MRHTALLVAFAFAMGVTPARAQDPDKPVTVQIGRGYTWTLSDVGDYLGDGYNFNIGVTWEASPAIGVEGLYSFSSSTDFGMVFGAGVNIAASDAGSVYLEFRYHCIWGPEINPSEAASLTGTTGKRANGQFLPIAVGIRF